MAQTWYLTRCSLSANLLNELTTGAPVTVAVGSGWRPSTNAAPNFATFQPESATPTWSSTEPTACSGKGFRIGQPLNGSYANANWVLDGVVRSGSGYDGTGQVRFRLWRSVNADMSSATQITNGWQASSTITWTAGSQDQTFQITWAPGATVTLTNEYLLLELEYSIVGTGGGTTVYVYLIINGGAAHKLTTPDFTPAAAGATTAAILMRC
jgi:hypothetical protein